MRNILCLLVSFLSCGYFAHGKILTLSDLAKIDDNITHNPSDLNSPLFYRWLSQLEIEERSVVLDFLSRYQLLEGEERVRAFEQFFSSYPDSHAFLTFEMPSRSNKTQRSTQQ